jgi:hypothetical protein
LGRLVADRLGTAALDRDVAVAVGQGSECGGELLALRVGQVRIARDIAAHEGGDGDDAVEIGADMEADDAAGRSDIDIARDGRAHVGRMEGKAVVPEIVEEGDNGGRGLGHGPAGDRGGG